MHLVRFCPHLAPRTDLGSNSVFLFLTRRRFTDNTKENDKSKKTRLLALPNLSLSLAVVEDRMRLGRAKARLAAPKPLRLGHAQGGKFLGIALGSTGAFASALDFRYR